MNGQNSLASYLGRNRILGFSWFLLRRFSQFNLNQVAASLTFTTLLALVPFFTIALVVIKAFPMFADLTVRFNEFISSVLVPTGVSSVQSYLAEFTSKAGNLTAIGIIALGVSAILLMMTIEKTFNTIWSVSRPRPLLFRLLIYWTVLTLGPLCIGLALSVGALVFRPSDFFADYPSLARVIYIGVNVFIHGSLFAFLYRIVPYSYVPLSHALMGGAVAGGAFEAVRHGFGFYVAHFKSYELIYGAFVAIPLFLLWLYCLWMIVLGGAVLTAGLSHWRDNAYQRYFTARRDGRLNDIVTILHALYQAQQHGQALTIKQLRDQVNLGFDDLGEILNRLARQQYIARSDDGWVLKSSLESILLSDLFLKFIYRPLEKNDGVGLKIHQVFERFLCDMHIPVSEFLYSENPARHNLIQETNDIDGDADNDEKMVSVDWPDDMDKTPV